MMPSTMPEELTVPPMPQPLRSSVRQVLHTPRIALARLALGWAVVTGAGFGAPYILSAYQLQVAVHGAILGLLALSIGWLLRQTGLLSFGHAAFYGFAGYTAALAAMRLELSTPVAVLLGVAAGSALAFVVGALIVRVPGIAFAMLTLAIGQLIYVASTRSRSLTNGFDGLVASFPGDFLGHPAETYSSAVTSWPLVWAILTLAVACLWWVSRTVFGRRLTGIRENEERVRFSGQGTFLPRVLAFTISGAFAGAAGVLSVLSLGFISPNDIYWTTSGVALIVAVIGGVGSVAGPPIGALAFVTLQAALAENSHYQVIIGLALIVVVAVAPGGITALLARAKGAFRLPGRRSRRA